MTDHEDYAHIRDPQSERTKWELWAIVGIVVVVLIGSLVWRVATHHPSKPETNLSQNAEGSSAQPGSANTGGSIPAAAAYSLPH
jgi:cytochrome c-type biogenesis protein CcmH/NrfF